MNSGLFLIIFSYNVGSIYFKKFSQNIYVDNIFDEHLVLKRNVFNRTSLEFTSPYAHELIYNRNLSKITSFTRWEVWMIIQNLLVFIPNSEKNKIENPLKDNGKSVYYSNDEDIVYQICEIGGYKISYVTDDFINNDLCNIVDKLDLKTKIKFIPFKNLNETALIKFRYFGEQWGGDEYYYYLTKSLK